MRTCSKGKGISFIKPTSKIVKNRQAYDYTGPVQS